MSQEQVGSLMTQTQNLLKATEKTLPQITEESGLPFYWLRQFSAGRCRNPSVNRVQKLYEHLSGKQLPV